MSTILGDIRHAFRSLQRRPSFTATVVFTLALGIGVNSAIFNLYNAVVLRPISAKAPERLVRLHRVSKEGTRLSFSFPEYSHFRGVEVFEALVAQSWDAVQLTDPITGDIEGIRTLFVSASYFSVISCPMTLGRPFNPEEDRPGAEPVAILGYGAWKKRLGADPEIVGKRIILNGRSFTVVGVSANTFQGFSSHPPDLFVPVSIQSVLKPGRFHQPDSAWLQLFAMLQPGTDIGEALPPVNVVAAAFNRTYLKEQPATIAMTPVGTGGPKAIEFLIVMTAVGLVLVIASANVSNLLMARAISRRKEFAVRLSLGATRFQLIRHCIAENLVLALLGAAVGVLAGYLMVDSFVAGTGAFYETLDLTPDLRVFAHAFLLALIAVLFSGVGPALRGSKLNANQVLKEDGALSSFRSPWKRSILVTSQVAASLLLLIVAGLLMKGFYLVQTASPGLVADAVIQFNLDLEAEGYQASQAILLQRQLLADLRSMAGVKSASYAVNAPIGWQRRFDIVLSENLRVGINSVSPDYFGTLGMNIVRGRDFTPHETSRVAIVSESLARRLWQDRDPIGQTIETTEDRSPREVVGVVNDLMIEEPKACLYRPISPAQESKATVLIKASGDPGSLLKSIRLELQAFDERLHPEISLLQRNIDYRLSEAQGDAILAGSVALLALALAVVGLYGVVSYATSRRTREIGLRMALGARVADILSMMVLQGMRPVGMGIMLGVILAGAASRILISRLYGLSPLDPTVYLGLSAFLSLVALGAIYLPARRAARTDPLHTLRWE